METQPSSQPTQSPKQPSHLPLAIVSVIISGLVFGLAGYWYGNNISTSTTTTASPTATATATLTPTIDPTASWQTYRNETIGLSFKYPSSIGALNILAERSTTGAGYSSDTNKDTKLQLGLRTTDWTFGRGAAFLDNAKPSFVINDSQFKPVKTLTVDGQKLYLADSASLPAWANPTLGPSDPLGKNSLAAFVAFTGNDGKTWGMVLRNVDTSVIGRATFEQIIGTMKFGKSVVAVAANPTAGWKTYTSAAYKISFKYPPTWIVSEDASMSRINLRNMAGDYDKSNTPASFEGLWFAFNNYESAQTSEDAIASGQPECCLVAGSVAKSFIASGSLKINTYTYKTVGGDAIEAYFANSAGLRFIARTATELSVASQTDEVAKLKQILATVSFTN